MRARRALGFATSAALHALACVLAAWMSSAAVRHQTTPGNARNGKGRIDVVVMPPAEPPGLPGLRPTETATDTGIPAVSARDAQISIPGFTFDFSKISDRAALLFPFVTPGLALEQFVPQQQPERRVSLRNPYVQSRASESFEDGDRPLVLDAGARQHLLDRTWSRRERWHAFQDIVRIANAYSPDDGDLPVVLRLYTEQNGLQPYVDSGIRDHRLWAQLGIAADHTDFIGFISEYAARHPSTRAATELLLLLDVIAQANLDDLLTLLSVEPALQLEWTRRSNRAAYNFIVAAQHFYKVELAERGLLSVDAIRAHYDAIRLAILDAVVRSTPGGYRASDARFRMGSIYWRQGNADAALDQWRGMTTDAGGNQEAAPAEVLRALDSASSAWDRTQRVDSALRRERGRWISLSHERLVHFGYRFDTF